MLAVNRWNMISMWFNTKSLLYNSKLPNLIDAFSSNLCEHGLWKKFFHFSFIDERFVYSDTIFTTAIFISQINVSLFKTIELVSSAQLNIKLIPAKGCKSPSITMPDPCIIPSDFIHGAECLASSLQLDFYHLKTNNPIVSKVFRKIGTWTAFLIISSKKAFNVMHKINSSTLSIASRFKSFGNSRSRLRLRLRLRSRFKLMLYSMTH